MSRLALVSIVFLQIQVSSQAVAEGRLLRGGIYVAEAAAQQQTISPQEWESRKFVRYIGQVDYTLNDRAPAAGKSAAPAVRAGGSESGRPRRAPQARTRR